MRRGRIGRMLGAGAVGLALHLCLLALLALHLGPMTVRQYGEDAFEIALVSPIFLPRRTKTPPPGAAAPRPPRTASPTVAPLTVPPAESLVSPTALPPAPQATAQGLNGDIGATLRQRLGCARADQAGLTQAERQVCADMLGHGARQAAALGQTVPAEKQAYYDAVKAARQSEGHGPGIGCHIRFGGGKPAEAEKPPHSLKLGPLPCFIVPPSGMLSPEADIPDPY